MSTSIILGVSASLRKITCMALLNGSEFKVKLRKSHFPLYQQQKFVTQSLQCQICTAQIVKEGSDRAFVFCKNVTKISTFRHSVITSNNTQQQKPASSMYIFRAVYFPKITRSSSTNKKPPSNECMHDADAETKMDKEITNLELCKRKYGRNNLFPITTVGNTESQYDYHLKGLFHFCKLIGDAKSMIIFS